VTDPQPPNDLASVADRVDRLDLSLFSYIQGGGTSHADRRSLLALHAALASQRRFAYLEIGSYHGGSLQALIADPRCQRIVSIDCRAELAPDIRGPGRYPENTTHEMLVRLASIPGADLLKLATVDARSQDLDPTQFAAELCFIDGEHTNEALLHDARFCRKVVGGEGILVFHDRTLVSRGIRTFLGELDRYRAYPLSHELLVVELGQTTLLHDPRVRACVPRGGAWLWVAGTRAFPLLLCVTDAVRPLRAHIGTLLLRCGAPRPGSPSTVRPLLALPETFRVYTFVTDERSYAEMRQSFQMAGFPCDSFERLSDAEDNPYAAITRIGHESSAQFPILCHQDVRLDRGAGLQQLKAALAQLDRVAPRWVAAGNCGVTEHGSLVRCVFDPFGGPTAGPFPAEVATLDENFLVLNRRNHPRCSNGLSAFHLYGTDLCLHARAAGGGAYVIDFPMSHIGGASMATSYDRAAADLAARWNAGYLFAYVITPSGSIFLSRSRMLRRIFGSAIAFRCIDAAIRQKPRLARVPQP